jgi:hypothetical protein
MRTYFAIISFALIIGAVSSRYISSSSEDDTSSEVDQDALRRDFKQAILFARLRSLLGNDDEDTDTRSRSMQLGRRLDKYESDDSAENVRKKRQIDDDEDSDVVKNNDEDSDESNSSEDDDAQNNDSNGNNGGASDSASEESEEPPKSNGFEWEKDGVNETSEESADADTESESNDDNK